jgi:hypothetical protein
MTLGAGLVRPFAHAWTRLTRRSAVSPRGRRDSLAVRLFGDIVFLLFLLTQLSDGVMTYQGIVSFGTAIEANPLLGWCIVTFGPGVAMIGAKSVATVCAAALHLCAMHRTIGALTLLYVGAALLPWAHVLDLF